MASEKIYLDSSVWISHFLEERGREKLFTDLLDEINDKNQIILVSSLVLLEVIEVMRKRLLEKEPFMELDENVKNEIKNKIKSKVFDVVREMATLEKQKRIAFINPQKSVDQHFGDILTMYQSTFGDIGVKNYCFDCRKPLSPRFKYLGVGHYDLQHAMTAKEYNAKEIVSFDKGFRELTQISEFKYMNIRII